MRKCHSRFSCHLGRDDTDEWSVYHVQGASRFEDNARTGFAMKAESTGTLAHTLPAKSPTSASTDPGAMCPWVFRRLYLELHTSSGRMERRGEKEETTETPGKQLRFVAMVPANTHHKAFPP